MSSQLKKILFALTITAISVFFYFVSKENYPVNAEFGSPTPTPDLTNCKVKTYSDKWISVNAECIDKIRIKGVLFVPKNQTSGVKSYWQSNMTDVFNKIKTLFEGQFNNLINISYETPVIIYGDKNAEDYDINQVFLEVKQKASFPSNDYYVVYMTYFIDGVDDKYHQGGFGAVPHEATQGSFLLDPESLCTVTTKYGISCSGYLNSAHEFGHALGIPHPWEEEQNKDSNGNIINPIYENDEMGSLMSFGGKRWPDTFIRQTVKNRMIISATPSITKTVRFSGDPKVYVVQETKIKWVPNPDVFNSLGLNWASIEVVPVSQKTNFQRAKLLRAENDQKVYYVTEGGLKRHIPNIKTFNSYGNLWQDVVVVKSFELSAIPDNQLIRQTGDIKVYKLENGQKRWIKTAKTFNRLGLNWSQIAPVNSVEINSYPDVKKPPLSEEVNLEIPFTSQAPFGDWSYPFNHTCEEAAVLMVHYYIEGKTSIDPTQARKELLDLVEYEEKNYGLHEDTNAAQTAQLIKDYYGYPVKVEYDISLEDIKKELAKGNPVIVPTAGRLLGNPYYTPPGPLYHMLLIKGYTTTDFITHDVGTKRGENFVYSYQTLKNSIHDLEGTYLENIVNGRSAMISVLGTH